MVYVFDNLGAARQFPDSSSPELARTSAADIRMAEMTSSYWVNFARSGDPNGPGLPRWPLFREVSSGPVLELGDAPVADDSLGPAKVRLYQALYRKLLKRLHVGG